MDIEIPQLFSSPLGGFVIFLMGVALSWVAILSAWLRKAWNPWGSMMASTSLFSTTFLAYERGYPFWGLVLAGFCVLTMIMVVVGFRRAKKHGLPFSPKRFRERMLKIDNFNELV